MPRLWILEATLRGLLLSLGFLLLPLLVQAEGEKSTAVQAYKAGREHFKGKRFADAILEFNKAYRLDPNPVLVFNMARSFEELKEYRSAIEYYRKYLEMSPKAKDRIQVEESLRTLELLSSREVHRVHLQITSTPEGAQVFVDGQARGLTPFRGEVTPGKHFIMVEMEGYSRQVEELLFKNNELKHHVQLISIEAAPEAKTKESSQVGAWTLLGLSAALLVGSAVSGFAALDRHQSLNDLDDDPSRGDAAEYDSLRSTGRDLSYLSDGLLLGGVASGITGAIFLFGAEEETASFRQGKERWTR